MKIIFALLVTLFASAALAQENGAPATSSRVVSPEVSTDRHVTFRLHAPKANDVSVSGEFMRGGTNLVKDEKGVWSVTVGPIEPEIYNYSFTIDGVRTIDPGNPELKTGSTPSTIGSVLEVRGDSPAFYDAQPVPHGEIRTHWYPSKSLGTIRRLTVYTPPGYDDSRRSRYPVLYLLHGANADENAWYKLGRANLILDNLIAAKKIKPFIVVMPFGYGVPPSGGGQGSNTMMFEKDLLGDVVPYIDSRYRTLSNADHRALIGLSMGGGEALGIGLTHIDVFSYVGGFSAGISRTSEFAKTYADLVADPKATNKKLHWVWIGCGTDDQGHMKPSKALADFLTEHKIKNIYRETEGAHTWMVWRRYLNEVAPQLFMSK